MLSPQWSTSSMDMRSITKGGTRDTEIGKSRATHGYRNDSILTLSVRRGVRYICTYTLTHRHTVLVHPPPCGLLDLDAGRMVRRVSKVQGPMHPHTALHDDMYGIYVCM